MDYSLITKLVKIVQQSEITDFSVQEGDLKIKISKNGRNHIVNTIGSQPYPEQMYSTQVSQANTTVSESITVENLVDNSKFHEVL